MGDTSLPGGGGNLPSPWEELYEIRRQPAKFDGGGWTLHLKPSGREVLAGGGERMFFPSRVAAARVAATRWEYRMDEDEEQVMGRGDGGGDVEDTVEAIERVVEMDPPPDNLAERAQMAVEEARKRGGR